MLRDYGRRAVYEPDVTAGLANSETLVEHSPNAGSQRSRGKISPKRPPTETAGLADIFPYYAGFSFEWACDELRRMLPLNEGQIVLDPWNGSGTTTLAAQYDGLRAIGVDLNPAASVVASLRCQVASKAKRAVTPKGRTVRLSDVRDDPLGNWFSPRTVARMREWTISLESDSIEVSALARVALFRAVRQATTSFGGSNPTWVKRAKSDDDLIDLKKAEIDELVQGEQDFLLNRLKEIPAGIREASIVTASSKMMPIATGSIDAILTSPPYLTRIDYAVAYSRELAVLGIDVATDRTLRADLMGTTLIRNNSGASESFGPAASTLISEIAGHSSKASGGYYLKQARQYLADLCSGFDGIQRVARPGARLSLVVQDSYYKDIHVALGGICIEEAERRGWELESVDEWPVVRSLTSLNRSAQAYKKDNVVESVVRLRKLE